MSEKACRNCHAIVNANVCPICKGTSLSDDWSGYAIILDPKNSTIAKRLNINQPGKYALKVR